MLCMNLVPWHCFVTCMKNDEGHRTTCDFMQAKHKNYFDQFFSAGQHSDVSYVCSDWWDPTVCRDQGFALQYGAVSLSLWWGSWRLWPTCLHHPSCHMPSLVSDGPLRPCSMMCLKLYCTFSNCTVKLYLILHICYCRAKLWWPLMLSLFLPIWATCGWI